MIAQTVPSSTPNEWPDLPPVTLPATGSDLVILAVIAVALVLIGLSALLARRRLR
jgi:LPXTG-motif cell wall-anchored protein